METFENLFNDGEEILKETPGYTSMEKTDLLKALQKPTQRVRNEVKLEQIIVDVEARKKMVDVSSAAIHFTVTYADVSHADRHSEGRRKRKMLM